MNALLAVPKKESVIEPIYNFIFIIL